MVGGDDRARVAAPERLLELADLFEAVVPGEARRIGLERRVVLPSGSSNTFVPGFVLFSFGQRTTGFWSSACFDSA